MSRGRWLTALVIVAALPGPANAACSVSATGVVFGVYDVFQPAPTVSTGTITYRCGNADHLIRISISSGSGGTFTPRTLQRPGDSLAYNLFLDAGLTQIWGDGSSNTGTYFIVNPPNREDVILTVFGRIPAAQDPSVGVYGDTVVVTIDY